MIRQAFNEVKFGQPEPELYSVTVSLLDYVKKNSVWRIRTSSQATLVRNCAHWVTVVKCRATSVVKKSPNYNLMIRQAFGFQWGEVGKKRCRAGQCHRLSAWLCQETLLLKNHNQKKFESEKLSDDETSSEAFNDMRFDQQIKAPPVLSLDRIWLLVHFSVAFRLDFICWENWHEIELSPYNIIQQQYWKVFPQ